MYKIHINVYNKEGGDSMIRSVRKPNIPFIVAPNKTKEFMKIINEKQEKNAKSAIAEARKIMKELMELDKKCSNM